MLVFVLQPDVLAVIDGTQHCRCIVNVDVEGFVRVLDERIVLHLEDYYGVHSY